MSSTSDAPDMPGERIQPGHVRSVWELTVHERDAIMDGLNIELHISAEPIPPVWLGITYEGAALVMRRRRLVADRFLGDDGRWYVRMVSENGTELGCRGVQGKMECMARPAVLAQDPPRARGAAWLGS